MNIVAIVQARMSSSRLPNKVLLPLAGKPVLEHVVKRLSESQTISMTVVATSKDQSDDPIELWCKNAKVPYFRGDLFDVLDRYYQAATKFAADSIVRITADCPVIDPVIVDEIVTNFLSGDFDGYALAGNFPDGLDCQIFSYLALEKAWKGAKLPSEREHVGAYFDNNPNFFKIGEFHKFKDLFGHRWTLDEPEDYEFLKIVFDRLNSDRNIFDHRDILKLMKNEPELMTINSAIPRNQGYLRSLKNDTP
jgi:spore coat polysaccharide biosynthesis protein SpsF (cytidylyltransferase family)